MKSDLLIAEETKAKAILPEDIVRYIEEVNARPRSASYLIAVLHKVQQHFGHLGRDQMNAVSVLMQIPAAKVSGVASFYHFFTFSPRGKHRVSVCLGTACFVKGAGEVLQKIRDLLGIDVGGTTPDKLFSVEVARCVGACALAPVVIVDERVYAGVTPDAVPGILAEYGFKPKK
jgi:NADH:ubiquinone oxidoreductase subunit E